MSLLDWLANRWLVEHETGAEEIAALLAIAHCRGGSGQCQARGPVGRLEAQYWLQRRPSGRDGGTCRGRVSGGARTTPLPHHPEPCVHDKLAGGEGGSVRSLSQEAQYRRLRNRGHDHGARGAGDDLACYSKSCFAVDTPACGDRGENKRERRLVVGGRRHVLRLDPRAMHVNFTPHAPPRRGSIGAGWWQMKWVSRYSTPGSIVAIWRRGCNVV